MSTPKQEKLARAIVENLTSDKPKTKIELAVSSGYAPSTAAGGVKDIVEQKGVQDALVAQGFTAENAKLVVSQLMLDEEQDGNVRLKAADMTFKVHGSYAPDKTVNLTLNAETKDFEKFAEIAGKYDDEMKAKLLE